MFFFTFRLHSGTPTDRTRTRTARRLWLEPLEDRTLPSFGFGWAFHVGGTDHDMGTGITTDSSGNVYVTGWSLSSSANFDPNNPSNPNNTLTNANPGTTNLRFVAKYTSNKTFQWVTGLGAGNESSGSITVDGAGNVFVADVNNVTDIFKLGAGNGTVQWEVPIPGTGGPSASVAVGPSGDVYVAGTTASAQAFVAKLDPSGNILWNQPLGGSSTTGLAVAVDSAEHVYMLYASATATTNPSKKHAPPPPPTYNFQVVSLNAANGSTLWSGSVGSYGLLSGYGAGITVDSAGNVYVAGGGAGVSNGAFFVAKLAPGSNGSLFQSWNEQFSGNGWASGVAVDGAGNVYTTGSFYGSVNFDPGPGTFILQSASGTNDCFVSELDTNGNFVTALDTVRGVSPNNRNNYGRAIALDSSGNLYTTGSLRGTADFDPGSGTYDLSSTLNGPLIGYQDVFVSQLTHSSIQPSATRGPTRLAHALTLDQVSAVVLAPGSATDAAHFLADSGLQGQTKIMPVTPENLWTPRKSGDPTTSVHPALPYVTSPITADSLFANLAGGAQADALGASIPFLPLA
jgi:hypothetical protein